MRQTEMRLVRLMVTVGILICAGCASSHESTAKRPTTAAEYARTTQPDGEKPICRQETVTGTRITKVVCLTPSQRAAATATGRKEAEDVQRQAAQACVAGACQG